MRRQKLPPDIAEEIMPKNIIMIGPTGVGKTEIARRLAKLTNSPFMKVEASKFTEVGYVGRDVESMIRDLVEIAVDMVREEKLEEVEDRAELNAEERLLDLLLPPSSPAAGAAAGATGPVPVDGNSFPPASQESHNRTREKLRQQFRESKLDDRTVEIDVRERSTPSFEIISNQGIEEMDINLKDVLPNLFGQRTKKRKMKVGEAFEYLVQEEETRLVDMDQVTRLAVGRGGAEGYSCHRGRNHRQHPVWHGSNRPHPFHRGGCIPRIQAQRSDSRVAGPVPHPGGAAIADGRGLCADSDRTQVIPHQAVHRAARNRRPETEVHQGSLGRIGAL